MNLPTFLSAVEEQVKGCRSLNDQQLRELALELSYEAKQNEKHTEIFVVKAFAVVKAAAERHLQMSHYPVQLQGGRAMFRGHVAEMRTGEGKTLTATLPLFVHALKGKGVLLATANDYLAKRDAQWMMPVYAALGLSTGVIQSEMSRPQRRTAYSCDITYGTMKEFGFDFLRDHSFQRQLKQNQLYFGSHPSGQAQPPDDQLPVQRQPHFLLIDEADSILIDDARTPLIISSAEDDVTHDQQQMLYQWSAESVSYFEEDVEYWYDKERKKVDLTPDGTARVREVAKPRILNGVGLPEMYDFVERAIQVARDYKCNRDYVVRDGEIVIVDEATGRISEGRRWSRGIHQAIEAKESVTITMDTNTSAKVTVQSFVSRYPLIAGMTGTAASASREFKKIYHAPVSIIPPNKPSQKTELPVIFRPTEDEKWHAVVQEIKEVHATHCPLLVGTRSIAKSEILSELLHQAGVSHAVLNARQIEQEAEIIAAAGEMDRVTVATNMAGRGTDIKIDDQVKALGGLHVICTEMHDSARIDLQLFGRCGRQGDPGSCRQYVSAEDLLLDSAFGRNTAKRYRKIGKIRSDRWWIELFRKAQKKLENQHYRARKILMYNEKQLAKSHNEMGLDPILDVYD